MQYMCIIYTTEGTGPQPGPDDWGPFMQGYQDFTAKVTQDGKLVHADALQPTQTATTVSMRDGKMHTTDGRSRKPRNSWAAITCLIAQTWTKR